MTRIHPTRRAVFIGGAAALYRLAPHDGGLGFRAALPGATLFTLGWLAGTLAFGMYVANFGNYNATYGSLGAIVILLTWFYLSAFVLLLGAEFSAAGEDRAGA